MSAFRRMSAVAVVFLAGSSVAQISDQLVAARVLGPRWQQMARASEKIFSGTVLSVGAQRAGKGHPLPLFVTQFRVDRAIAGVRDGQVISVREWAGAWANHHAMRSGQRMLVFLYPPSRLGLTSPVGGPQGQVRLDPRGEIATIPRRDPMVGGSEQTSAPEAAVNIGDFAARVNLCPPEARLVPKLSLRPDSFVGSRALLQAQKDCFSPTLNRSSGTDAARSVTTLTQVERAIRAVRRNPAPPPTRIKE